MQSSSVQWNEPLVIAVRYLLAMVFIASTVGKVLSPAPFYDFVGALFSPPLGFDPAYLLYFILAAEILIVTFLLFPETARAGAMLSFVFVLAFTILLMFASQREVNVPCGCFGEFLPGGTLDTSILRNLVLLPIAVLAGCPSRILKEQGGST